MSVSLHSQAVSTLLVGRVGQPLVAWFQLKTRKGELDGKDARCIMVRAIFQPPSTGGRVTSLDEPFPITDALLIVGSGCLSGLYLPLCFDWKFSLCHVTIMFALGIIPFLQLQPRMKSKYCLLLRANSSLQLLSNSQKPMSSSQGSIIGQILGSLLVRVMKRSYPQLQLELSGLQGHQNPPVAGHER